MRDPSLPGHQLCGRRRLEAAIMHVTGDETEPIGPMT